MADHIIDPDWRGDLARFGEEAAIASRQPPVLADLLVRSAQVYANSGDRKAAERQWVRALAVADDMDDRDRYADLLLILGHVYRRWGRLHKALDVFEELVDERERTASSPIALATALAEVGTTMLDARRPTSAAAYLSRADDVLTSTTAPAVTAVDESGEHGDDVLSDRETTSAMAGDPLRMRRRRPEHGATSRPSNGRHCQPVANSSQCWDRVPSRSGLSHLLRWSVPNACFR